MKAISTLGAALLLILASGCGRSPRIAGPPSSPGGPPVEEGAPSPGRPPLDVAAVFEEGEASWYGDPYHGRQAASGEVFDKNKLTAAHRTLAFDTWVRVENQSNGRTVDVRITDRGPFVSGRIIDLSEAAAREIDMIRAGVAPVRVSVLRESDRVADPGGGDLPGAFYVVQLGAFSNPSNAQALARQLTPKYTGLYVEPPGAASALHRVLIGRAILADARFVQDRLRVEDGIAAIVLEVAD